MKERRISAMQKVYFLVGMLILLLASAVSAQESSLFADAPLFELRLDVEITSLDLNTDQIAAVSTASGVRLYNAQFLFLAQIHDGIRIEQVVWNPVANQLALVMGSTVEIWNWDPLTHTTTLETTLQAEGYLINLTWSPDGAWIAGMSIPEFFSEYQQIGTINLWDTQTWQRKLAADKYAANPLTIVGNVMDWNPLTPSHLTSVGYRLRFESEGILLDTNHIAYQIDATTGQRVSDLEIEPGSMPVVAWHPDGSMIATATDIGVSLFDATTGEMVEGFGTTGAYIQAIDWNEEGTKLIAGKVVIDIEQGLLLGAFETEGVVVDAVWRSDEYQGTVILAEKGGRITIQTIDVLPNYVSPTPTPTPTR
jgi:WD40 repeat protein